MNEKNSVGLLVVDGDCGFCLTSVRWIKRNMIKNLEFEMYQRLELGKFGLSEEECQKQVQYVYDSKIYAGAEAYAKLFSNSNNVGLRLLGLLMRTPIISQVTKLVYQLIAANRSKLPGGTPYCELPASNPKNTR